MNAQDRGVGSNQFQNKPATRTASQRPQFVADIFESQNLESKAQLPSGRVSSFTHGELRGSHTLPFQPQIISGKLANYQKALVSGGDRLEALSVPGDKPGYARAVSLPVSKDVSVELRFVGGQEGDTFEVRRNVNGDGYLRLNCAYRDVEKFILRASNHHHDGFLDAHDDSLVPSYMDSQPVSPAPAPQ